MFTRAPLLVALLAGCTTTITTATTTPATTTPATPATPSDGAQTTPADPSSSPVQSAPFGGRRYGFVEATSANGRFVALRRFIGDDEPRFGHHGEVLSGAELHVFDLTAGTERAVADIIDVTPDRRYFLLLLLEGDVSVLLDTVSGVFEPLAGADTRSDENRCLPPRQAAFSPHGKRVGWVTGDAARLHVRDLATGQEWDVAPQGRLWRGWPDDTERGAMLAELEASSTGFPRQQTSCSCRWCTRFAASFGFYGWRGDAFTITHVDEHGVRQAREMEEVSHDWFDTDEAGCDIEPRDERGYERGPWHRTCP